VGKLGSILSILKPFAPRMSESFELRDLSLAGISAAKCSVRATLDSLERFCTGALAMLLVVSGDGTDRSSRHAAPSPLTNSNRRKPSRSASTETHHGPTGDQPRSSEAGVGKSPIGRQHCRGGSMGSDHGSAHDDREPISEVPWQRPRNKVCSVATHAQTAAPVIAQSTKPIVIVATISLSLAANATTHPTNIDAMRCPIAIPSVAKNT